MQNEFSHLEEIKKKILEPSAKTIFLLGGPDTGKTTLIEDLIDVLWNKFSLGIVDCDMGQSHIGPPTTIAWAKVKEKFTSWKNLNTEDFYFVGSLSPSGNTKRVLEASGFIFKKASQVCNKVIIDTTGYIQGPEAVEFKIKKINLIKPDLIIALSKVNELAPILRKLSEENFSLFKIDVPPTMKQKTEAQRLNHRQNLFKDYFSDARLLIFDKRILLRWDNPQEELLNKIVALRDLKDKDFTLGLIKKEEDKFVHILVPSKEPETVSSIVVGNCYVHL